MIMYIIYTLLAIILWCIIGAISLGLIKIHADERGQYPDKTDKFLISAGVLTLMIVLMILMVIFIWDFVLIIGRFLNTFPLLKKIKKVILMPFLWLASGFKSPLKS